MRKCFLPILLLALFSCTRTGISLIDTVPKNADLIVESSDSTLIMLFDSLLSAHVDTFGVADGTPMALVRVPQDSFLLVSHPTKKDLQEEKLSDDPGFARLQGTLGQNVRAHVYYRHANGWALLDVLPEGRDLMMNGYALAADSASAWRPLKYQLPVKNSVVNILPSNTSYMHHYSMSDYASYWESFCDEAKVDAFNRRYHTDVKTGLLAFLSEVSLNKVGENRREVFVARMNDPSAVIGFMERLASRTGVATSQTSQGYVLYNLGRTSFIPDVFGEEFQSMDRCCYAIVDQYLVMAPGFDVIREVISCYRSGRTLDLNEGFRNFHRKMLESANITVFEVKADRKEALQLASSKDLVYVNACVSWETEVESENNVRWKVNLDAPLKGQPFIVEDPISAQRNVVAFDQRNTLYFIDADGTVLWKKQFNEAPMGRVFAVECRNDGKVRFLFNTAHTLQLLDRDGNNGEGYPVRLPFEASNGLSVFDYNGDKDYRILLCGTDRLVYNYTLAGEEVEGWNRHRSEDLVRLPVQHLVSDGKDYLIVSDITGGVRILDRQGRIRIPLSSDMSKSPTADIYTNVTNSRKGLFLTSDLEGKLLYIASDGALTRTDFGTYSNRHFFLYEDFNGDQDPDFIYLDGQDLKVFNRFKNELFSHHFDVEISTKPVFFNISRSKRLLGVVSENAREIALIDRQGRMIVNSGLVGETPFAVGSLRNGQEINLITGVGDALYNYVIY